MCIISEIMLQIFVEFLDRPEVLSLFRVILYLALSYTLFVLLY